MNTSSDVWIEYTDIRQSTSACQAMHGCMYPAAAAPDVWSPQARGAAIIAWDTRSDPVCRRDAYCRWLHVKFIHVVNKDSLFAADQFHMEDVT